MEELVILLLQGLVECVLQVLGSGFLDLLTWWGEDEVVTLPRGCTALLLIFAGGWVLGWLSLLLLPHNLMPFAWLRLANLVAGPCLSAWLSWLLARQRQRRRPLIVPWHHAGIAAAACSGLVLVRFIWGVR